MKEHLDEYRYVHSLGVQKMAADLAKIYGTDVEKADFAGRYHDIAKCFNQETSDRYVRKYGLDESLIGNRSLAHSKVGAAILEHEYGVDLVPFDEIPKADCVIVAVGHKEYRSMSTMQLKSLFKEELSDEEKVLIDVKSLYRMDELQASGMRFWRL